MTRKPASNINTYCYCYSYRCSIGTLAEGVWRVIRCKVATTSEYHLSLALPVSSKTHASLLVFRCCFWLFFRLPSNKNSAQSIILSTTHQISRIRNAKDGPTVPTALTPAQSNCIILTCTSWLETLSYRLPEKGH